MLATSALRSKGFLVFLPAWLLVPAILSAEVNAPCEPLAPQEIRTEQIKWKDGGSSLITTLTLEGKRVDVLLRLDAEGKLMIAELSTMEPRKQGLYPAHTVSLTTTYGEATAPYTTLTRFDETSDEMIREFYNFRGVMTLKEKTTPNSDEEKAFTPDGTELNEEERSKLREELLYTKQQWLKTSDFSKPEPEKAEEVDATSEDRK